MSCSADYSFVFWSGSADYYFVLKSPPSTVYQLQCHTFLWFCGVCHTFYLFCLFHYMHSKSHSNNDTSLFAEASLHFLNAFVLIGEKPPWGAEPRFELGPAGRWHQQQSYPHPN
jgi:hypothetical protein